MKLHAWAWLGAALAWGAPCHAGAEAPALDAAAQRYQQWFRAAAEEFGVPVELLEAIAYAETRWQPHVPRGRRKGAGEPEVEVEPHHGMPIGYGIMGLRDDVFFGRSLRQGAALIGLTPAQAAEDTRSNIRAAAALLARHGAPGSRAAALEDWEAAVARYSGIAQADISRIYTYEVFAAIQEGRAGQRYRIGKRPVALEAIYGKALLDRLSAPRATLAADHPSAIWRPAASCNYSARSTPVSHLTLHTTQGSYAAAISWFQHCGAGVSAHYVIRSSDGQVTQMVREADKAWHAGNANGYTVGIEHEGYVDSPKAWYSEAMYQASAALARDILAARGLAPAVYDGALGWDAVPADALYNVKGHVNYARQTHSDPGAGWDWPRYRALVGAAGPGDR
ncbi:hypothetical protein B0920_13380 [Massilia sp. KIM]|uniref:N-acetylmuramoyl-L-alanine amidase n=1 Tax=Massilia sp. KIM TaxID=1955422 RepID=UPI0009902C3C|nr:peptidoglycan recognition family protein [Massilia sp. KIM]OON64274.1 hypothetical protein B0920_13380 [Massilia sp. KIM]